MEQKNKIVICLYAGYEGYLDYTDIDERGWVRLYVLEPILIVDYIDTRNDKNLVIPNSQLEKTVKLAKKLLLVEKIRFN